MAKIKIMTNIVYGGWAAKQLESGIGGSEEKLIEWAREMVKLGHDVTIYMNGEHGDFAGVKYRDHRDFKPMEKHDVFISFKARDILANSINATHVFHWTTEIESEWPKYLLDNVDKIFTISNYQNVRMKPKSDKFVPLHLWADFGRMDRNTKTNRFKTIINGVINESGGLQYLESKEENSMLYSSSFDRGLEELLVNWELVKKKLGVNKLYITYGWDFMKNLIKSNPQLHPWKARMEKLMEQEGIELVGRLTNDEMCAMYWKCQYWCLPCNNPDAELFCINAVKAQYAGCIPVVRKIGGLQETVNKCINWDEILGRPNQISTFTETKSSLERNRQYVVEKFDMNKQLTKWNEYING